MFTAKEHCHDEIENSDDDEEENYLRLQINRSGCDLSCCPSHSNAILVLERSHHCRSSSPVLDANHKWVGTQWPVLFEIFKVPRHLLIYHSDPRNKPQNHCKSLQVLLYRCCEQQATTYLLKHRCCAKGPYRAA